MHLALGPGESERDDSRVEVDSRQRFSDRRPSGPRNRAYFRRAIRSAQLLEHECHVTAARGGQGRESGAAGRATQIALDMRVLSAEMARLVVRLRPVGHGAQVRRNRRRSRLDRRQLSRLVEGHSRRVDRASVGVDCESLQTRDEATLEELCLALEAESIKRAVTIAQLDPEIVHEVPLDQWRDAPELSALQVASVHVDV